MDMDLKTRIEVLPCGKCEDMLDCDTCIFSKKAKELYKQIRAEVIEEYSKKIEIWCWKHEEYNQDELNELMAIAEQLKEQNK